MEEIWVIIGVSVGSFALFVGSFLGVVVGRVLIDLSYHSIARRLKKVENTIVAPLGVDAKAEAEDQIQLAMAEGKQWLDARKEAGDLNMIEAASKLLELGIKYPKARGALKKLGKDLQGMVSSIDA